MDWGTKHNKGKLEHHLIPISAHEEVVKVFMHGAEKYTAFNWKKGRPYSDYYDAMLRHANLFLQGEDDDGESGLSHLAHIAADALILLSLHQGKTTRKKCDDRKSTQLRLFQEGPKKIS